MPATCWAPARPATGSSAPSSGPSPFALLVHTLIVLWYARYGHDPADIDDRRAAQPWYRTKTEPAFEDMLIKLRRTLIAARFSGNRPAQPTDDQIRAVLAAWNDAAA